MSAVSISPKPIVAAILTLVSFLFPVKGESSEIDELLRRLAQAEREEAIEVSREIELQWSKSGSAAMDLLLKRGREALERGDLQLAAEHFGALTDHAPEFAAGWAARAKVWHHREEFGLALADLQRALQLHPNHYEAMFGLAVTLEQLEQPDLALGAYRLVLQIHPHYDEAAEAIRRLEPQVQGARL